MSTKVKRYGWRRHTNNHGQDQLSEGNELPHWAQSWTLAEVQS